MEPTGFFKPAPSLESTSLPTESFMKSAARKTAAPSTPEQGDPTPFKASAVRSRDASVSSVRPNHDDMILPAVARRIKEQGLHEHDVIAYSDAYDAPLYKLPASPAYENNPFASYDRAKAVSTSSLAQQKSSEDSSAPASKSKSKSKIKTAGAEKDSEIGQEDTGTKNRRRSQTGPPAPEATTRTSIEAPSSATSPSERANRTQRSGVSRSSSRRQRRQQQEQQEHDQHEQRGQQEQYEQQEQYAQHEQYHQQHRQNAQDATSAQEHRPERPRRTKRNTDRQLQQDSSAYNDEPMPRRERRPTNPGNQENARTNDSDNMYQQQNYYHGHNGAQKDWNDSHDPYSRQQRQAPRPESWDRRRPTNDDGAQQSPYAYKQNGNMKNGHEMAQYGAKDEMSRHNQRHYAGDQLQGHLPHRDAHNDYRHQQGYNQEQGGYRYQHQDDYKAQGTGSSQYGYQTQNPSASRPSYPQPEMVQMEMSQMDPTLKEDEQRGADGKNGPSQENIKKKKGAVCCIIC
ncbi:hypothetical protein BGZ72_010442 [Mortierella alpina]|nr:hypothetical protein BGZ72_010442 [Mortierella alpina]